MYEKVIDDPDFEVFMEFYPEGFGPYIHLKLNKWTPETYKRGIVLFQDFHDQMKELGFKDLYVAIPYGDEKLLKFETMMGFEIEGFTGESEDEPSLVHMIRRG